MRKITLLILLLACAADARTHAVSQTQAPRPTDTRPELYVQGGFDSKIGSLVFSSDRKYLACLASASIFLWEVGSGLELRRFESKVEGGNTLALSGDAKLLAIGGGENIEIWDVTKAEVTNKLAARGGTILSLALSADGRLLVAGGSGAITLWDVGSGKVLASPEWPGVEISAVAFSPNGRSLAAGSTGLVKLYDVQMRKVSKTYNLADTGLESLVFRPDGKLLALDLGGNTVWNVESGKKSQPLLWFESVGSAAALDSGGDLLALAHPEDGFVALLDWKRQRCVRSFGTTANDITTLAFTSDGKTMFAGDQDGDIKYIDLTSGRVLQSIKALWQPQVRATSRTWGGTHALVLSPDGRHLFSSAGLKDIKLWDVEAGKELQQFVWFGLCENCLAFTADGKLFAATSTNGVYPPRITLFDLATGNSLAEYDGHQDNVNSLTFSRDGAWLASGSSDETVRLWNLKQGKEARVLRHAAPVRSVAFSPDGKVLASGGEDGTIRLWDSASGAELRVIKGHGEQVDALEFGPGGRQLASLGGREIKLWNVADGSAVRYEDVPAWVAVNQRFGIINLNGRLVRPVADGKLIKLTDLRTKEDMASLLSLGDTDWMVITPDGSFDSSSIYSTLGAWKHLLWRFNNNTFDYAPVEAFFGEFYRPGLLKEVVGGARPKALRELPTLDRRPPRVNLSLATLPPPQDRKPSAKTYRQVIDCIDVPHLSDFMLSSRVQQVEVEVAEALGGNSASGIRDVRLFRNNSLVKIWRGQTAEDVARQPGCRFAATAREQARKVVCAADVTIVAGVNYLRAYAFNHDNVKSDDAVLILEGAETLTRADATLYILAVGVNRYADSAHDLRYAVADAEAVGERLAAQQPLTKQYTRAVTVRLLDGDATKENILLALHRLGAGDEAPPPEGGPADLRKLARMRPEDALLIYFAGHGESDGDRFYLIPHDGFPQGQQADNDARQDELRRRSISDRELEAALEPIDAGKMLMVIDACDSGQALESDEKRRGPMNSRGMAQMAFEKGFYVLTAAQSRQAAQEVSKLGHGLLTFALLEGLAKADANGDGLVTVREWFDYASEQVPLLQLEAMRLRSEENSHATGLAKRSEIVFGAGSDANLPPNRRGLQVPRSFYRAETEGAPFVVSATQPLNR
jgi:WD40 repeat protein